MAHATIFRLVGPLAAVALAWRLVVAFTSPAGVPADTYRFTPWMLAGLGLVFLACGIVAFRRAGTPASALFALYTICETVHWGGAPTVEPQRLQWAVWVVYFLVSMLGTSVLLHFTLVFPHPWTIASRALVRVPLYGVLVPAALVGIAASITGSADTLSVFLLVETIQIHLYGLLALVVVIVRFWRAAAIERSNSGLGILLAAFLLGVLPPMVASFAIGDPGAGPFQLIHALLPIGFAYAIVRSKAPDHRP